MKVRIHTLGIRGSDVIKEGDEPSALLHSAVEVDGVLIDATRVRVLHGNDNLASVMVRFTPGDLETIAHTRESWDALWRRGT